MEQEHNEQNEASSFIKLDKRGSKAYALLRAYRHRLTRRQLCTLKGQILAGDTDGALKGLKTLLERGKYGQEKSQGVRDVRSHEVAGG